MSVFARQRQQQRGIALPTPTTIETEDRQQLVASRVSESFKKAKKALYLLIFFSVQRPRHLSKMVAVRRHNPHLRTRGKKNNNGVAQYVRLAFWGLLVVSLGLAVYLVRRVATQSPPVAGNGGGIRPSGKNGAVASGGEQQQGGGTKHHVALGNGHDLPVVEPHYKNNEKPNLRKPFIDPVEYHDMKKKEQGEKSKSVTQTEEAPPEQYKAVAAEQTDPPTLSPIQQMPRPKPEEVEVEQEINPVEQMLEVGELGGAESVAALHAVVLEKKGTGPTRLGFVKDFAHERAHPVVWEAAAAAVGAEMRVSEVSKLADTSLKSCTSADGSLATICKDADTMLYAYNNANFTRTMCGMELEPHTVVKLDSLTDHACLMEPTRHILPRDIIPVDAKGMQPVQVVAHEDGAHTAKMQQISCDIPCEYDVSLMFDDPPRERFIHGEGWKILLDGPEKPKTMEKMAWKEGIFYSGPSRQSSIPVSTFDFEKYDFRDATAIDFDKAERGATYFANDNCQSASTRRHKWLYALQTRYPVLSYGKCDHNTDGDVSTLESRLELMRKNRLALAYESSTEKDAFTQLTWEALLSGAVPVIVGPSNAMQVLPPKSFIWYGFYNNWDKFSEEVVRVADDKAAWESYQEWRNDEAAVAAFEEKMNFSRTSLECRTCRWAYAKMYSLHWDADQQEIKPSTIPRDEFCVSKYEPEQLSKPFREIWSGHEPSGEEETECHTEAIDQETSMEMDGYRLTRTVLHHDGVTDLLLKELEVTDTDKPVVLRLQFDVKNFEGAYFPHPHSQVESHNHHLVSSAAIQDMKSRVTVLADWKTDITSPAEGVMEVKMPSSLDEMRRIRIIIEDVDTVNFKLTEFSPFNVGQKMTQDFVDPIELYYPAMSRR